MKAHILEKLKQIEIESDIDILFACESGSRAWGFASKDSDYDVRFVYKRRIKDYLRIQEPRDTMDLPIESELDFSGWDLRKFLRHLHRSNAVVFEWLQSPMIYFEKKGLLEHLWKLSRDSFDPRKSIHHYLGLTRKMYGSFNGATPVKLKKYFYIVRPILAAYWIKEKGTIAPMALDPLLDFERSSRDLLGEIQRLRQIKEGVGESFLIERSEIIDSFVEMGIDRLARYSSDLVARRNDSSAIDDFFFGEISG